MTKIRSAVNDAFARVTSTRHLAPRGDADGPIRADAPRAIVAGVPDVHVEAGSEAFCGRRKRITLEHGADRLTLLARVRRPPVRPAGSWLFVREGCDRRGARFPVCCVDGPTRTVHVLIELSRASVVDRSGGPDPIGIVIAMFVGEPLEALLGHAREPSVGSGVRRAVGALLETRPEGSNCSGRSDFLQREIAMLRRFGADDALPGPLLRRLEMLRRAVDDRRRRAGKRRRVTSAWVDDEVGRLVQLVRDRACGALLVGPDRIDGLLSPCLLDDRWRLRPAMFRLDLDRTRGRPLLSMWNPSRQDAAQAMCLGYAEDVIHEQDRDGDVYGMVDTVINYRETNLVGAVPYELDSSGRFYRRHGSPIGP